jgi:hypothetical protein
MEKFNYAYEKVMSENKLTMADLNEDAKIGIKAIVDIDKMAKMQEKKTGKPRSESVIAKIKYHDKAIVAEIYDILEKKNPEAMANKEVKSFDDKGGYEDGSKGDGGKAGDDQQQQQQQQQQVVEKPTQEAIDVEAELENLFKTSSKKEFHLDELKTIAPKSWNLIFNNYSEEEDNGVETSKYRLFEENSEKMFTLSKL